MTHTFYDQFLATGTRGHLYTSETNQRRGINAWECLTLHAKLQRGRVRVTQDGVGAREGIAVMVNAREGIAMMVNASESTRTVVIWTASAPIIHWTIMSMLSSIQQSIHKAYVKTVEKVTPTLSTSKYLEEGVLTPDEVQYSFRPHKFPIYIFV